MPKSGWIPIHPPLRGLECPFLYQTRSILGQPHPYLHSTHAFTTHASRHLRNDPKLHTKDADITADSSSFLKRKAAQVAPPRRSLGPSITPAEQAAFDKIWKLFEKPSSLPPQARVTSTNHTDTNHKNILELFSPLNVNGTPEEISQDAAINTSSPSQIESSSTYQLPHTDSKPFNNQRSFPTEPRLNRASAVREVQGFLRETDTPPTLAFDSQSMDSVQSTAHRIVEDVADSLVAALASKKSRQDIAMWKVAEEKIFPLIKLLTPSKSTLSQAASTSEAKTTVSIEAQAQSTSTATPTTSRHHPLIPPDVPLLPVLSQTYPALTLHILRSYAAHVPTSPYALALLPTLKSLGPTSYVLGAHTHFYNSLLSLHWRIYSDFRGINDLLSEMEANGMEFNVGTWEALRVIGEDRERDLSEDGDMDGERSEDFQATRGRLWWERHEQMVWWQRVGVEWKEFVRKKLEDKGVMVGEVMREDGRVNKLYS